MPHDYFVPLDVPYPAVDLPFTTHPDAIIPSLTAPIVTTIPTKLVTQPRLATVDPIRDSNAAWGAKACAGDALSRCEDGDPMICMWIDKDGEIKWSASNLDRKSAPIIVMKMTMMAQQTLGD